MVIGVSAQHGFYISHLKESAREAKNVISLNKPHQQQQPRRRDLYILSRVPKRSCLGFRDLAIRCFLQVKEGGNIHETVP